ncbi:RadC family protein [Lacticaseibacillus mingshuiensis]|uniref:RadC family protein n=1 Tax=Lacticaseibacillus mingshuiensis TaxID=2799574 RepID=UPI00194FC355|nr:DNA repair protein RadC [Lacticaseibacillus mingshuiensis]
MPQLELLATQPLRPREKLLANGPGVLSDEELLAVLLGAGSKAVPLRQTIAELLARFPNLAGFDQAAATELLRVPGIGLSKATLLAAAAEFGTRVQRRQYFRFGQILSSQTLGETMIRRFRGVGQEVILILLLDVKNKVIQELEIARGGLDAAFADPRVIFRAALVAKASKLILVHNHPSGDSQPSENDRDVTDRFTTAGAMIGIDLLDHVIVGADDFYSFAQQARRS